MTNNISTVGANFTNNLQYLMQKVKVTSVDLAENIGVSAELIGKLRKGTLSNPTLKVLAKISRYFNVSLEDLAFGKVEIIGDTKQIRKIEHIPVYDSDGIANWQNQSPKGFIVTDSIQCENKIIAMNLDQNYGIFEEKSVIFVDTKPVLKSKNYVLVLNNHSKVFTINQVLIEDYIYLKSLILDGNINKYDEEKFTIFGTVISYQKFFK